MPYKPMTPKLFNRYLEMVGWRIEKGSIDWNLYDGMDNFLCTIQISHGSRMKQEVTALSVRKVEKEFKKRQWTWPPTKKSKKS